SSSCSASPPSASSPTTPKRSPRSSPPASVSPSASPPSSPPNPPPPATSRPSARRWATSSARQVGSYGAAIVLTSSRNCHPERSDSQLHRESCSRRTCGCLFLFVILSVANGVPGQLAGWGRKNPRISLLPLLLAPPLPPQPVHAPRRRRAAIDDRPIQQHR